MRLLHVVPVLLVPTIAFADVTDDATDCVKTGSFLPFTDTPATETHTAKTFGTYDGARGGASLMTSVEAKLSEKFQVAGEIEFDDGETQPSIEAQYDLLDRKSDGFDLQVAGGVDANGFNEVPALFTRGTIGGFYRETYLVGAVGFELGTERGEAASSFGLAGMRDLGGNLYMGFDSRMSFDLERDDMEPEGESSWEIQAGPLVSVPAGRFALTAAFGMSAREERDAMTSDLGAYGSIGAGAVF
jgi:hypothetical protein